MLLFWLLRVSDACRHLFLAQMFSLKLLCEVIVIRDAIKSYSVVRLRPPTHDVRADSLGLLHFQY